MENSRETATASYCPRCSEDIDENETPIKIDPTT